MTCCNLETLRPATIHQLACFVITSPFIIIYLRNFPPAASLPGIASVKPALLVISADLRRKLPYLELDLFT